MDHHEYDCIICGTCVVGMHIDATLVPVISGGSARIPIRFCEPCIHKLRTIVGWAEWRRLVLSKAELFAPQKCKSCGDDFS